MTLLIGKTGSFKVLEDYSGWSTQTGFFSAPKVGFSLNLGVTQGRKQEEPCFIPSSPVRKMGAKLARSFQAISVSRLSPILGVNRW